MQQPGEKERERASGSARAPGPAFTPRRGLTAQPALSLLPPAAASWQQRGELKAVSYTVTDPLSDCSHPERLELMLFIKSSASQRTFHIRSHKKV